MDVKNLEDQLAKFIYELETEDRLVRVGLKEKAETAKIYKKYQKLFTKEVLEGIQNQIDQLRRSSLSIVLVIAEGSAKRSDKDFNRYIEMGMGSANETASGLDVSFSENLIKEDDFRETLTLCENVVNQLGGFSKKLKVDG